MFVWFVFNVSLSQIGQLMTGRPGREPDSEVEDSEHQNNDYREHTKKNTNCNTLAFN